MKDPCFPGSWAPIALSQFTSVISSFLAVFITVANFLLITAIVKDPQKKLRSPFAFFLVNLALSDFIVGIIAMPVSAIFHAMEANRDINDTTIYIVHVTFFISLAASLFSLVAMCIDRYYTVLNMKRHSRQISRRRCIAASIGIWVFSLGFTTLYLLIGYIMLVTIYIHLSLVFVFGITLVTYIKIIRRLKAVSSVLTESSGQRIVAKGIAKDTQMQMTANTDNKKKRERRILGRRNEAFVMEGNSSKKTYNQTMKENRVILREKRITSVFLAMLATFLSSCIPAIVLIYLLQVCLNCSCDVRHVFRDIVFLLLPTGSGLNAVVCIVKLPYIRAAVSAIFTRRHNRTHSYGSTEVDEVLENKGRGQREANKKLEYLSPQLARQAAQQQSVDQSEIRVITRPKAS